MKSLKHPNVIDIYQFFKDDPNMYYVSIEYMRGGELFDRIVKKVRERGHANVLLRLFLPRWYVVVVMKQFCGGAVDGVALLFVACHVEPK